MASRQQINKAIERIRGELRGLVDTDDGQGFIIAVNDGASSTVCATGKPEALVAVVTTMATEPAIREVFEEAARQCLSRWPSAPPDIGPGLGRRSRRLQLTSLEQLPKEKSTPNN